MSRISKFKSCNMSKNKNSLLVKKLAISNITTQWKVTITKPPSSNRSQNKISLA